MALSTARRLVVLAATSAISVATARAAHADDNSTTARRAVAARELGRPHTVVEVGAGIFALPAAQVCPTSLDQCSTGEISLGLGIRNLYQFGPFGIGAGITWGTTLRNDDARGAAELQREHARRYFMVDGLFRYSYFETNDAEAWFGGTLGLVGVLDSWTVEADRDPPSKVKFVGPDSLGISTEGFSASVAAGGSWFFADNVSLGGIFQYGNWVLPFDPHTTPLGDVASLKGRLDVFQLSLTLAYRIAL
ncbi:MAG TPA: hypothetical protein VL400_14535 [Polyangiaceae bacterium]|jgi:hypothetical protein|nr:hypothetical protein [Polyangiaceae bacterium]